MDFHGFSIHRHLFPAQLGASWSFHTALYSLPSLAKQFIKELLDCLPWFDVGVE